MKKTLWKINFKLTNIFQTCIERQWLFEDKKPLIERKWVDKDMLPFYILNYR